MDLKGLAPPLEFKQRCRVSATKNGGPGVVRAVRTDGELPQPDGAEHDQLGGGGIRQNPFLALQVL